MDMFTLPNVKCIASGKQPHNTGRSALCFVNTYRGGIGKVGGNGGFYYGKNIEKEEA